MAGTTALEAELSAIGEKGAGRQNGSSLGTHARHAARAARQTDEARRCAGAAAGVTTVPATC